ncbi:hypothetical protein [Caulobacter sp. UNC279MFTsu5.1]|uniref:hypothetical protein n=1 Tax=Caulobacter sp. UNC279MFTsu5.1 TaxID=1502775 RepID=UPI0008EA14B8|nr:hypothetical protein [Caulobacter sp. UNC279MFTsu5.1]SFK31982.1 hypothetical protein SAMN02799626_03972 [Caulobacter sp. UNC279MFTsu5.1]
MLQRYINFRLVAILAVALLVSWIAQGLTYAVLREISPPVGAWDLIDREIAVSRHDRIIVHLAQGQNLFLLAVQTAHVVIGLAFVVVFLAAIWTYEEPKSRAERTIRPLSLDSPAGPEETPRP